MAVAFKESKTKENLMKSFAGESQARNRYTMAAELAGKNNLYAVQTIFQFTADQERAHAKVFYDFLRSEAGQTIKITGTYPVDHSDKVTELLKMAAHNEKEEHSDVYPAFGRIAREEGFEEIAHAFFQIAEVEKVHGLRFEKLAYALEHNEYFQQPENGEWMCLNCGHIVKGMQVPPVCPSCHVDRGYYIPACMAPYFGFLKEAQ